MEELIVHRVQCPRFDLGPLAAHQWEEVWWTKFHNHKRVTEAWKTHCESNVSLLPRDPQLQLQLLRLTIGVQRQQVRGMQHLHSEPLLRRFIMTPDSQAPKPVLLQRPLWERPAEKASK